MSKSMSAQRLDFNVSLPGSLYWDASFLVHATYPAGRYYLACYAFLERLENAQDTLSYVSTLTLDEAIFTLLRLKVAENHPKQGFWQLYRENPAIIQPYLQELGVLVERLSVDPRVRLVGTERDDVPTAMTYMIAHDFLPRDAMHLAVMARLGIDSLVTTDADFVAVNDLCLFTCNPLILDPRLQ
jgi:predicted nucleic acid-binding protein